MSRKLCVMTTSQYLESSITSWDVQQSVPKQHSIFKLKAMIKYLSGRKLCTDDLSKLVCGKRSSNQIHNPRVTRGAVDSSRQYLETLRAEKYLFLVVKSSVTRLRSEVCTTGERIRLPLL